jgi:hypothetical protein
MDLTNLKSWYQKGLIGDRSPVLTEGTRGWLPLADAFPDANWRTKRGAGAAKPAAGRGPGRVAAAPSEPRGNGGGGLRLVLIVAVLAILAVGGAVAYFTLRAPEADSKVLKWASFDRRVDDSELGLSVVLPNDWHILREGCPLVSPFKAPKLLFGHSRGTTFAYLVAGPGGKAVVSVDQYLDAIATARKATAPGLRELGRSDGQVGNLPSRTAVTTADGSSGPQRSTVTAWKDGWIYFALVASGPGTSPTPEVDSLLAGISNQGLLAARLREAISKVTQEVPHLTADSAEMLMLQSDAHTLDPPEAFRRAFSALNQNLPRLDRAETNDLRALMSTIFTSLQWRERSMLESYQEDVRARKPTTASQDSDISRIVKAAVLRLPVSRRMRLQQIYDHAIRVGLQQG